MTHTRSTCLRYKVVETSAVHDQGLEAIINRWVRQGWQYDGMQFAMHPSSRRPTMAFVLFTREEDEPGEPESDVPEEDGGA